MKLEKKIALNYITFIVVILISFSFTPENEEQNSKLKVPQFINSKITDGPFFFIQDDNTIIVKWLKGKKIVEKRINNNYKKIQRKTGLPVDSEIGRASCRERV